MDCVEQTQLSLDEIIQLKQIPAPPSTTSAARRLSHPYSKRGRGFAKLTRPRDSLTMPPTKDMLESAYRAGLAAGIRDGIQIWGFQPRGGFQRWGMQRGGFHRGGRFGVQRFGVQRHSFQPVHHQPGWQQTALPPRGPWIPKKIPMEDLGIQISIPTEGVGKAPLRDRLGWFPWQPLTPAQQVARGKLALAKQRLRQHKPEGWASKAVAVAVIRGKQDRANSLRWQGNAASPGFSRSQWARLENGVAPLSRGNVALLSGNPARGTGQSVKSFSARSRQSRGSVKQRNRLANQSYLAERQFEGSATASMSTAALQERLLPSVPWGSFNRNEKHNPQLDAQLQAKIRTMQELGPKVENELPMEDFDYTPIVMATQTSSSDRFSLMMTLPVPGKLNGFPQD